MNLHSQIGLQCGSEIALSETAGRSLSYSHVGRTSRQHELLLATRSGKFLDELAYLQSVYVKMETERRRGLRGRLLDIGKHVSCGDRIWHRRDLEDIASWKGLPPNMLMLGNSEFEDHLESALRIEDEAVRVSAMCDIRGMGPILVSTVSMFTWPDTSAFMDYHTFNALRFLGFEFPRKHYTNTFTLPQLQSYLRIVRGLRDRKGVGSMEIAEALYALDRARTTDSWRRLYKSSGTQSSALVDIEDRL